MSVATPARVREEILEPLRRTLRWLAALRDHDGRIVCPEHKVEHTGKSAGAIVLACELAKLDPGRDARFLRDVASSQARRLVLQLQREGTSPCHTFRPGRHDPFNCSNNVIDGGACADALSHLVIELGPALDARDRDAFRDAALLHARTYLRYAVLDKGVPAQRAWGLTGLAGAIALERDPELEAALDAAVEGVIAIQHADGSYPYHPMEWGGSHPGSSDVSAFYQSRVGGFVSFALERAGRDPRESRAHAALERATGFLLALSGPDGTKCGGIEAKPWYWGASYEVASNVFDVHALATARRLSSDDRTRARCGAAAIAAFRAWSAHLDASGEPKSHRAGPGRRRSYQCPVFWAAHASWMARAAGELEQILSSGDAIPSERDAAPSDGGEVPRDSRRASVAWFADAQLARLEDAVAVAWVRGASPPFNVHHGSPCSAGLLRVHDKRERRDLFLREPFDPAPAGEWSGAAGRSSLARGWRSGASELGFSIWLARVSWRAKRRLAAIGTPWRVFREGVLAFGDGTVSSGRDRVPEVDVRSDAIALATRLAFRDGTPLASSRLERRFRVDGRGLTVEDRVLDPGGARDLDYELPEAASEVEKSSSACSYRLP